MKKAVALLSGGLDSATAAAIAVHQDYEVYALSFDYQQRHRRELESARRVAQALGVREHHVICFDLRTWGGSALTSDLDVPLGRTLGEMSSAIPVTYVPARNTIFLSFALSYAEVIGAETLVAGMNQLDYSGYPDCRREYLDAFETMANLATKAGVEGTGRFRIWAPLVRMTKAEIIREGVRLGLDYRLTWSCYSGEALACGQCDSCLLRQKGFEDAGMEDPISYSQVVTK